MIRSIKLTYKIIRIGLILCLLFPALLYAGDVTLSWDQPVSSNDTLITGHKVYYGTSSGNYTNGVDAGNVTTCNITGLTAGMTYYFAVTSYDSSGNESGFSNEISTTVGIVNNNPPSIPQLVSPVNYQMDLETTAEFQWEKSVDPDGDTVTYDIYICEDENFSTGCITETNIASARQDSVFYADMRLDRTLFLLGIIIGFINIAADRDKIMRYIIAIIITGMLLVSCGGGGGGGGNGTGASSNNGDTINGTFSGISTTVSGLKTGTAYYWKVLAMDNKGGETVSSIQSFDTR